MSINQRIAELERRAAASRARAVEQAAPRVTTDLAACSAAFDAFAAEQAADASPEDRERQAATLADWNRCLRNLTGVQ